MDKTSCFCFLKGVSGSNEHLFLLSDNHIRLISEIGEITWHCQKHLFLGRVGCRNFDGVEWRFFEGPFNDELYAKEIAVMLKTAKYS